MSFRLGVLVSGTGSNLQAILDKVHGRDRIEVVGVASNKPGVRALERAQEAGVDTAVFETADHPDRAARDRAIADWLEGLGVDLVVTAGYMELLSPEFVGRFRGRIVNVHPALLPAFPGIRPIEDALEYGVRVSGVTVHFLDEGIDSGPVILQEAVSVPYTRDAAEFEAEIHRVEHVLLPRTIQLIAAGAVRIDPDNPRVVHVDEQAID
jgi:phosphoribosylglycinamide formyltransferase-1